MTKNKEDLGAIDFTIAALVNGVQYAVVETALLICFVWMRLTGDHLIWEPLLWMSMGAAVLWVLAGSNEAAHEEAKDLVLNRQVYISDFMFSSALMIGLAIFSYPQGWHFAGVFLIAAGQNLRYTHWSMQWLLEEKRDRERRDQDNTDNDMP